MLRHAQHRLSMWLILLCVASMLTLVVVLLSAAPAPITWTPATITATLTPGASTTRAVSFTSSQNLSNVIVRVVPALQPLVQVAPASFSSIAQGKPTTLTLTIAALASALPGTVTGTIQLRTGSGQQGQNLPLPLPVTITILAAGNTPPVANAGKDFHAETGMPVMLVRLYYSVVYLSPIESIS